MDPRDDERTEPETDDRVGLGRVVRDDTATGPRKRADKVEEASSDSFPASDPPSFSPARPAPAEPGITDLELPDPRDVP